MNDPRVGIVIPVYNRRKELKALLESLSRLNYREFDILVVDNGSSENIKDLVNDAHGDVLTFPKNNGAIFGFNEGARHLLSRNRYHYLWLLDSDLTVEESSLTHLVSMMENDRRLGICASIIYNIDDKNLVVEAGARIDLVHGIVAPILCNARRCSLPESIDVDYAGSGVSLLRVEMVEQVGLYDERYHFLWEDMDYGLHVRKHGWRVAVSSRSEVYHPPFTEKRGTFIYAYYGVRNPLLTASRHTCGFQLLRCVHGNLRRSLRIGILKGLYGLKEYAILTFLGIGDFVRGRLGASDRIHHLSQDSPDVKITAPEAFSAEKRILILASANRAVVANVVNYIRVHSNAEITMVVQEYRANLFAGVVVDSMIIYNERARWGLIEYLRTGAALVRNWSAVVDTDPEFASPLTFFSPRAYAWDERTQSMGASKQNLFSLWKPIAAVICSELLSLLLTPVVFLSAHRQR